MVFGSCIKWEVSKTRDKWDYSNVTTPHNYLISLFVTNLSSVQEWLRTVILDYIRCNYFSNYYYHYQSGNVSLSNERVLQLSLKTSSQCLKWRILLQTIPSETNIHWATSQKRRWSWLKQKKLPSTDALRLNLSMKKWWEGEHSSPEYIFQWTECSSRYYCYSRDNI